jgi:hypothetical protein
MISIIQSRYRHILPSSKSCSNYVTTSIIENGNRFCSRTRKMEILFCIGLRGGLNGYVSMGRQRINTDWGGIIQAGVQLDAHNYLLGEQSVTDFQVAIAPRMGLELFRSEGSKRSKKRYKNTIAGGVYLAPHIGVAQVHEQVGHAVEDHLELSVGSQLQFSMWID